MDFQGLEDRRFTNFNIIAATAWLGYDILITSSQEMRYIWRSSWSAVKVLYLLIRYYSMAYMLMTSFATTNTFLSEDVSCKHYLFFSICIIFPVVDLLVVMRLYALFNRKKQMRILLAILWLAETICGLALIGLALKPLNKAVVTLVPGLLTGCTTTTTTIYGLSLASQGVWCAFQAIYVTITMCKLVGFGRMYGFSFSPLLNVFFRDGAAYFLIILAVNLFAMFADRLGTVPLLESGPSWHWQVATASVTACRLMLNLRHIATPSQGDTTLVAPPIAHAKDMALDQSYSESSRKFESSRELV